MRQLLRYLLWIIQREINIPVATQHYLRDQFCCFDIDSTRYYYNHPVYAKSSEVLPDIFQTDWIFLPDRKKYFKSVYQQILINNWQKCILSQRENENKITISTVSVYLSFVSFFAKFCQTKVTVNGNTEWFPLVRPYWICSKYLKETVKDHYNYGKSLR